MRIVVAIAALAVLGGCNMVHSSAPMFSAADSAGAPTFRDGVWASPDRGCQFDPNTPVKSWPKCADGSSTIAPATGETYLFVAGDPLILQVRHEDDDHKVDYYYAGVEPLKLDAQGRITAFKGWLIQCGPPPPAPKSPRATRRYGTRHPLQGLTMDPDGDDCMPASPAAVRAAAAPSRAWTGTQNTNIWVRDTRDGDK
jgi:hypothetical protein